jgi:hypothetical protein
MPRHSPTYYIVTGIIIFFIFLIAPIYFQGPDVFTVMTPYTIIYIVFMLLGLAVAIGGIIQAVKEHKS